jgi:heat shock protein HtpX
MKRVVLFLATNLAILLVLSFTARVLGLDRFLTANGIDFGVLLGFAALIGFGGSLISLAMSKTMAKMATRAQVINHPSGPTERWLLDTVARQASAAGIGMPEVAIYNAPDLNAFATGMSRDNALVAVSTGLLQGMNADEVEAVLAHEVSHVANGDMVTLALIQGVVNTFVIFLARLVGVVVDGMLRRGDGNQSGPGIGYYLASMVAELLLGVIASMVVMWFSRQREFRADAGGAKLAGRHKMISALERLQQAHMPSKLPGEMAAFGIGGGRGIARLFMTHPPLAERIDALRRGG